MLAEIWQEITELTKDSKFVRNLGLVTMITLVSSCSLATEYTHPERLAQQEKIEQFSGLMSVGLCLRTQIILNK
jgi:hypothetical protein